MKKYSILFCLFLQLALVFAQAPEKMSYQAVVRNNNNVLVSNHAVGMRISILQGSATGTAVYTETQTPTTNANGLIAIEIGTGTVVSGTCANIDWANGPYFVKTETDPNGGTAYTLTSSNQLLSVPYALYAKTAGNAGSGLPSGAQQGQTLTMCDGQFVWTTGGLCQGKISGFNCSDTVHIGFLTKNVETLNGVNSNLSYFGGNGGVYNTQTIASTGVIGLTATLISNSLNIGDGIITVKIMGIPQNNGTARFNISIGGKTCTLEREVGLNLPIGSFKPSSVFCIGTPTTVVNVINPLTGKTWMDRNLGASRAATSSTDTLAYGDLYQWGRGADGHQCRNSSTISTLSSLDITSHDNFIIRQYNPFDWRSPQNDGLWQGVNGVNNPCPIGYRIPTYSELEAEKTSWNQDNSSGAFNSKLKIPMTKTRVGDGTITGGYGQYWTSSTNGIYSYALNFTTNPTSLMQSRGRVSGLSIRCIKD